MSDLPGSRFHMVSLGCVKNTVDSDSMAELLRRNGYQGTQNPEDADVLIVNTCGFIEPAKQESIQILSHLAENKSQDQWLIAAGCLTQRYGEQILKSVPGIDGVFGTRRWMDIVDVLKRLRESYPEPLYHLPDVGQVGQDERGVRRVAVQGTSAYLKIADGCRRPCAFCAIPSIKGPAISRPLDQILEEAEWLEEQGIREIILIAQDTTDYGHDLGMKDGLTTLLERLVERVSTVDWIRLLYAYPGYVTDRLIDVLARHSQLLPYLDMPLQHADPAVLRSMRRPANVDWVYRTLEKLRTRLPHLALRSTFMVGYPTETPDAFDRLKTFIREIRFDRLGVFPFSFEPGTPSESLGDPIPAEEKETRRDEIMRLQQQISLERNQKFIGQQMDVLIEGLGDGISIGRSYRDAPEIDGLVLVEHEVEIGNLIPVQITGALPYDLSGIPVVTPETEDALRS
jgi:ribosomal protein S12 methylthiotransferase